MPSVSGLPEVPGGMLIHYSPLNEPPRPHAPRRHATGLVAARVQRFEAESAPSPSSASVGTPTPPSSPLYELEDTAQGIKVLMHFAALYRRRFYRGFHFLVCNI